MARRREKIKESSEETPAVEKYQTYRDYRIYKCFRCGNTSESVSVRTEDNYLSRVAIDLTPEAKGWTSRSGKLFCAFCSESFKRWLNDNKGL